jgi:hypothetical protein
MLIPIIEACIYKCKSIKIKDVTGFYNSETNDTGWGAPNLARDFTGTAVLEIKTGTTVMQYDVKQVIEDSIFPTYILKEYTDLVDGVYSITLTLVDTENNVTYKANVKITSECDVACCVAKLAVKDVDKCKCDSSESNFAQAEVLLSTLPYIASCLGEAAYNKQLKKLQKICSANKCSCS